MTWVQEYGRHLSPRELAIHNGTSGHPPEVRERFLATWRGERKRASGPKPPSGDPAAYPCPHRSPAPTGKTVECASCGKIELPVYHCAVHGECVIDRAPKSDGVESCKWCFDRPKDAPAAARDFPEPPPGPKSYRWVRTNELVAAAVAMAGRLPLDAAGVVGIPRSGMIPAAAIATHLHLPLYELTRAGQLKRLSHGSRGGSLGFADRNGPLVVVDDTVYAGGAMSRVPARLKGRPVYKSAVYVRPEVAGLVDLAGELLPCPHLLEWNIVNCGVLNGSALHLAFRAGVGLDIDGVVIHDAKSGGQVGTPFLVPRTIPAPLLCTGRNERHRAKTEAMLRTIGAKWARLEMLPNDQPMTDENAARHKAKFYAASKLGFFIESEPCQAEFIHRATGKPVICPLLGKVFA